MTEKARKLYSDAQNVALVAQVESICPLCSIELFQIKGGKSYKAYEIAHIYPLSPTQEEIELLKNEERLGEGDVNHEDNVIPLCLSCHGKYDKPRTVSEYRTLLRIKKKCIEKAKQQALWSRHSIEEEIRYVINRMYSEEPIAPGMTIEYDPKTIDEKLDDTITLPTARKIKNNVSDYYTWLRCQMEDLDRSYPEASQIISLQVKGFYLKQKQQNLSQQAMFDNIVEWVYRKTQPQTADAAEILTAFFVQNCEVFE